MANTAWLVAQRLARCTCKCSIHDLLLVIIEIEPAAVEVEVCFPCLASLTKNGSKTFTNKLNRALNRRAREPRRVASASSESASESDWGVGEARLWRSPT